MALETDLPYLEVGQTAWFYPDDPTRQKLRARIREIREVDEEEFALPYLASNYGGSIPVRESEPGKLKPDTSVYRILLDLEGSSPMWKQAVRGILLVESRPWSVVERVWERVSAVLIREGGF
jgi:putative peptide zinc metalloprotease protein